MTENIPPSGDATRGVPYYEKLKRDLRETLQKKRLLDKNLAALEEQLYRIEGSYLEETNAGNIIKGFDNYIKGSSTASAPSAGGGTSTRRKGTNPDQDRVFSRSSASFMREGSPSSAATTPGNTTGNSTPGNTGASRNTNAPTPTSTHAHTHQNRRDGENLTPTAATMKKKSKKDEDEEKPAKRLKISYGRERD